MDTPPRAAIYTRISKDREGSELGVERQEEDCLALAERLGLDVGNRIFRDNDISASTLSDKRRPAFEDMIARSRDGEFGTIIAYSNSRLTRRPREYETLIDLYQQNGVVIRTVVSGDYDLSQADGRAVARTIAAWDAAEAERTGERIRRQKRQRAEMGHWHGGTPPYGFKLDEKTRKLVLNPAEVSRIEDASKRMLDFREPMHSIVKDWNESGITTRGGHHWRQSNLRSILTNRALLGETKAGAIGWDPILDQRTFDRLQEHFSDPSRKMVHSPGVKGGKYTMGGGLTVCARCGRPLTSQVRNGSRSPSLICNKQVQGPHASHPQVERTVRGKVVMQDTGRVRIDHDSLEAYVFDQLTGALNDNDLWRQGLAEQDPDLEVKVEQLERHRAELRDERDRAGRAFVAGIMTEVDAKSEVDRVDAELLAIQSQINDLLGRSTLPHVLAEDIDWQAETPGVRRSFLRLFIDRIAVSEWPEGVSRNPIRKRDESDEAYAARQREHRTEALDQRVRIMWKWQNPNP